MLPRKFKPKTLDEKIVEYQQATKVIKEIEFNKFLQPLTKDQKRHLAKSKH